MGQEIQGLRIKFLVGATLVRLSALGYESVDGIQLALPEVFPVPADLFRILSSAGPFPQSGLRLRFACRSSISVMGSGSRVVWALVFAPKTLRACFARKEACLRPRLTFAAAPGSSRTAIQADSALETNAIAKPPDNDPNALIRVDV